MYIIYINHTVINGRGLVSEEESAEEKSEEHEHCI